MTLDPQTKDCSCRISGLSDQCLLNYPCLLIMNDVAGCSTENGVCCIMFKVNCYICTVQPDTSDLASEHCQIHYHLRQVASCKLCFQIWPHCSSKAVLQLYVEIMSLSLLVLDQPCSCSILYYVGNILLLFLLLLKIKFIKLYCFNIFQTKVAIHKKNIDSMCGSNTNTSDPHWCNRVCAVLRCFLCNLWQEIGALMGISMCSPLQSKHVSVWSFFH